MCACAAKNRKADAAAAMAAAVKYIRNTPKRCGSIGALSDAEIARPRMRRVSAGSMMPSSHSRALA
jgi:hypothetical protein